MGRYHCFLFYFKWHAWPAYPFPESYTPSLFVLCKPVLSPVWKPPGGAVGVGFPAWLMREAMPHQGGQ